VFQVLGPEGQVVPRGKRGSTRCGHRSGSPRRPDGDVPEGRAADRVAVRRAPGARGRRGLRGRPRGRLVVRVLHAVVPVLRPARQGQERAAEAAGIRLPPAAPQNGRLADAQPDRRRVPGVLRAVRAPLHAGQGERRIRHGRVHRLRTHAEA